jgi:CHAT domain-containing protein
VGEGSAYEQALVLSLVGNDGAEQLGGVNDGLLRLPEVTFLKLNADVVVLSACQTARGPHSRGEGVSGLARAFLYAGSRGVVCSLWGVDDERTADLMADFYRGLKDGRPAAEALRLAQLAMLRRGQAPFFWAPFVLMGE